MSNLVNNLIIGLGFIFGGIMHDLDLVWYLHIPISVIVLSILFAFSEGLK